MISARARRTHRPEPLSARAFPAINDTPPRHQASAESHRADGFAAFARAQRSHSGTACTRRSLSAEWLQLTVRERREWRVWEQQQPQQQQRSAVAPMESSRSGEAVSRLKSRGTPPRARRMGPRPHPPPQSGTCARALSLCECPSACAHYCPTPPTTARAPRRLTSTNNALAGRVQAGRSARHQFGTGAAPT
jgi:hypothetical protein